MSRFAWRIAAWRIAAVVLALACAAPAARSHDSWLAPSRHGALAGQTMLELGTGNRYPLAESGTSAGSVAGAGCVGSAGEPLALLPRREQPQWLELAAGMAPASASPAACWVALDSAEVEIKPPVVETYFREIRATAAQRQAWAAIQARGLPWRESYRKFARIELPAAAASAASLAAARKPLALGLEIVVVGDTPIAVGRPLVFQVLRDGQPLPGLAVELVSERSPLGLWGQADENGRLRHSLPFSGRWLLRAVDLRLSPQSPDSWQSRFATLAIEAP